ncbi:MAG: MBL fold metallo-hydrolase, partial [Candidatus Uhrbacteria bacterium]
VSHAHADHTGRLPKLIRDGFRGKIYMTPPTRPLARLILEDSFHIMQGNHEREGHDMLFTREDVDMVMPQVVTKNYHEMFEPLPGVTVMYHDAGHILGSAYISVDIDGQRIVFSGDMGNNETPILPDHEPISHADYIISESTYGDRNHETADERRGLLRTALIDTVRKKGVLMIPAFSIERTQELLYELDQILLKDIATDIPIFLDSPLAIKATAAYRHYQNFLLFNAPILDEPDRDFFSFPNLRETVNSEESKAILGLKGPKIVIAGSGMMSGGRIMHHLINYLPSADNHLLIIGYQAHGTLGRRLYEGTSQVRIYGQEVGVQAKVSAIGSFSAHADQRQLDRWLIPEDQMKPKKIFLVHGDEEVKSVFAEHIRGTHGAEVVIPEFQSVHEL